MDENELRDALRTTMTRESEPPPMGSAAALATAKRVAVRRNLLAGTAAAVAIAAITAAAVIPGQNLLGGPGTFPAGAPAPAPTDHPVPEPDDTKPSWPPEAGGDATYDSGEHFEKGKLLLDELLAVVPEGYTKPAGQTPDGLPLRSHQATVEENFGAYSAIAALSKDGGTGRLLAEVYGPGNVLPIEPCELAKTFWGMDGTCQIEKVAGKRVGVVVKPQQDDRIDQWAAYRHGDGTVVIVAQGRGGVSDDPAYRPLVEVPFTVRQVAALAAADQFRLD
ncbi:hypothetical protein OHA21_24030 [Actinoplanes sp. NBC_00393]|uniref:hypothetical protein n=1 Tax=Actinoplanes sp. NBC_00393 TaxID=2975953 RepID=UPI002E207884